MSPHRSTRTQRLAALGAVALAVALTAAPAGAKEIRDGQAFGLAQSLIPKGTAALLAHSPYAGFHVTAAEDGGWYCASPPRHAARTRCSTSHVATFAQDGTNADAGTTTCKRSYSIGYASRSRRARKVTARLVRTRCDSAPTVALVPPTPGGGQPQPPVGGGQTGPPAGLPGFGGGLPPLPGVSSSAATGQVKGQGGWRQSQNRPSLNPNYCTPWFVEAWYGRYWVFACQWQVRPQAGAQLGIFANYDYWEFYYYGVDRQAHFWIAYESGASPEW